MPRPKPRYAGDGGSVVLRDFSVQLREKLRTLYRQKFKNNSDEPDDIVDSFVEHILSEARYAISENHWQSLECTREDIKAEQQDLLKSMKELNEKLRSISLPLDRLIGVNSDPLGCADRLDILINAVAGCDAAIRDLPTKLRIQQAQSQIIFEMSLRVLRALNDWGVKAAATGNSDLGYSSLSVDVLKAIGDDISLVRSVSTWRDTVQEVKAEFKDIR